MIGADAAELTPATRDGELHRRFHVYVDPVGVVVPPLDYESRLTPLFPGWLRHLRLWALDHHDLALCKLGRNAQRDRDDVMWLARRADFDPEVLKNRYRRELRSLLTGRAEEHDLTLQLWLEMIAELHNRG